MIISLFMDEAPLMRGSGTAIGVALRAGSKPPGTGPGSLRHPRTRDQDEHQADADDIHVSATAENRGGPARPALSW
jgi:hypothetical protein